MTTLRSNTNKQDTIASISICIRSARRSRPCVFTRSK